MILPLLLIAVTSITPTTTPPTPTPTNQDEIQRIRNVVQQKVKEKLKLITENPNTPKATVGKIIQLDASNISLEFQSSLTPITYSSDTIFIDQNRNKITSDKLKIGQDILAMGTFNSTNNLEAKRIVITDLKKLENTQMVVIGKIVDISKTSPIFSLIPQKNKNTQYQVKNDSKTQINSLDGTKITSKDLKVGDKIITILTPDPKIAKTYYATKILNLDYQPNPTPTTKP